MIYGARRNSVAFDGSEPNRRKRLTRPVQEYDDVQRNMPRRNSMSAVRDDEVRDSVQTSVLHRDSIHNSSRCLNLTLPGVEVNAL